MNSIWILVGIAPFLWGLLLLALSDSKYWFFFSAYFPLILVAIYTIPLPLTQLTLTLLAVGVVERVIWGLTLYDVAGEDKIVTFYLVLIVPLIGWLVYNMTKLA